MDNAGKKLRKLFDFQRFEREPVLQNVIDGVEVERTGKLSDDELEFVAGGVKTDSDSEDPQKYGRCPTCGGYMEKDESGIYCPNCNPRQPGFPQIGNVQGSAGKNNMFRHRG